MLPPTDQLTICFAHVAYRLRERFLALATGVESFEVRDGAALEQRIGEADVLVISGLWRNDLLTPREAAALHPVDRCRHRPVLARGAQAARRAARERPRRQCPRGLRARHGTDAGARAPASRGARQPGKTGLARYDRRPHAARGRTRRQDAAGRRPRTDRRPARAARQGVRHARDRHPPRPASSSTSPRCAVSHAAARETPRSTATSPIRGSPTISTNCPLPSRARSQRRISMAKGIAEPGGICISRQAHEHLLEKLSFTCEKLGPRNLKNIAKPVEVYSVNFSSVSMTQEIKYCRASDGGALPMQPSGRVHL